jgi:hypothetical protein
MTGISEGMAESQALWRMWKAMEGGGEVGRDERSVPDELTLAAFAEGRLAAAEHAAVAALLAEHPDLGADVAAAMAPATVTVPDPSLESIIARAQALVAAPGDGVVPFRAPSGPAHPGHHGAGGTSWRMAARWGSLAASFALVSWLGFALGNDAYGSLAALDLRTSPPAGATDELLDPPSGFFDLGEVSGT